MFLDKFIYTDTVKYEQYIAQSDTGVSRLEKAVEINGLILKGHYSYSTGKDGETVSSNFTIRTKIKIPKKSKLNGHEVMDSVRVDSLLEDAGYINYCK